VSALEPLERPVPRPAARPSRWRVGPELRSFAALGDSFTAGTGCGPGERWADRLATRLAAGRPGFEYRNFAVEGATSEQVLDQVGPALRFDPDLATVVCGANDVLFSVRPDAEVYARRLSLIFKLLSDSDPELRLLTATAPERWDFLELGRRTRSRLERGIVAFNEATRAVAEELGVPCLDVAAHPGLDEAENFIADGLHPSAHGHDQAATGFARLLELDREGDR
jgi:lysophospholipase L1-like esterase